MNTAILRQHLELIRYQTPLASVTPRGDLICHGVKKVEVGHLTFNQNKKSMSLDTLLIFIKNDSSLLQLYKKVKELTQGYSNCNYAIGVIFEKPPLLMSLAAAELAYYFRIRAAQDGIVWMFPAREIKRFNTPMLVRHHHNDMRVSFDQTSIIPLIHPRALVDLEQKGKELCSPVMLTRSEDGQQFFFHLVDNEEWQVLEPQPNSFRKVFDYSSIALSEAIACIRMGCLGRVRKFRIWCRQHEHSTYILGTAIDLKACTVSWSHHAQPLPLISEPSFA